MGSWDRRSILIGGASLVGAAALPSCTPDDAEKEARASKSARPRTPVEPPLAEVMPVLVALAEHILPSDDLGPGAREANVAEYLERALADPRLRGTRATLSRGAMWLTRTAQREHGRTFPALGLEEKERYVMALARGDVRPKGFNPNTFVRLMIGLTLEGFLCDPKHGGNEDEVGWKLVGGVRWAGRG